MLKLSKISKLLKAITPVIGLDTLSNKAKTKICTIGLTVLIIIAIVALIFTQGFTDWLVELGYLAHYASFVIYWGRLLVLLLTILLAISLVYNYGPVRSRNWRFISAGSLLATFLIISSSQGFSFYVEHFSTYNKFYGQRRDSICSHQNACAVMVAVELCCHGLADQ